MDAITLHPQRSVLASKHPTARAWAGLSSKRPFRYRRLIPTAASRVLCRRRAPSTSTDHASVVLRCLPISTAASSTWIYLDGRHGQNERALAQEPGSSYPTAFRGCRSVPLANTRIWADMVTRHHQDGPCPIPMGLYSPLAWNICICLPRASNWTIASCPTGLGGRVCLIEDMPSRLSVLNSCCGTRRHLQMHVVLGRQLFSARSLSNIV